MGSICPLCQRSREVCGSTPDLDDFVQGLLDDGYKRNYTIIATKLYRVSFAHPKLKHIIEIANVSPKTDATRAARIEQKRKHLRQKGWKISVVEKIGCRTKKST